jgi:hypothetical protein
LAIGTIAMAQLLRLAVGTKAVAAPIASATNKWAQGLVELAHDLNSRSLTVTQWQDAIEALHKTVPIEDVLKLVDFDLLRPTLERTGRLENHQHVLLPGIKPTNRLLWTNLFVIPERGAIPPHGHNELVTAHLIVRGRLHARTFARVADEPGRMLLRSTRGDVGAIASKLRDHLIGTAGDGRIYLDPAAGRRADGLIEAAVINYSTSLARFGGGGE